MSNLLDQIKDKFLKQTGITDEELQELAAALDKTRDDLDATGLQRKTTDPPDEQENEQETAPPPDHDEEPGEDKSEDEDLDPEAAKMLFDRAIQEAVAGTLAPVVQAMEAQTQKTTDQVTALAAKVEALEKRGSEQYSELTSTLPKGIAQMLKRASAAQETQMSDAEVAKMGNPNVPDAPDGKSDFPLGSLLDYDQNRQ